MFGPKFYSNKHKLTEVDREIFYAMVTLLKSLSNSVWTNQIKEVMLCWKISAFLMFVKYIVLKYLPVIMSPDIIPIKIPIFYVISVLN